MAQSKALMVAMIRTIVLHCGHTTTPIMWSTSLLVNVSTSGNSKEAPYMVVIKLKDTLMINSFLSPEDRYKQLVLYTLKARYVCMASVMDTTPFFIFGQELNSNFDLSPVAYHTCWLVLTGSDKHLTMCQCKITGAYTPAKVWWLSPIDTRCRAVAMGTHSYCTVYHAIFCPDIKNTSRCNTIYINQTQLN